jgi:hypothetical protein
MLGLVRLREGIAAYPQKPAAVAGDHGFGLRPEAAYRAKKDWGDLRLKAGHPAPSAIGCPK